MKDDNKTQKSAVEINDKVDENTVAQNTEVPNIEEQAKKEQIIEKQAAKADDEAVESEGDAIDAADKKVTDKEVTDKEVSEKEISKEETNANAEEKQEDVASEVKKIRTVHGQQIDLEEVKEKEEGLKFNSFKERMEYYWDYYKWTVGVAAVLAIITITLIRAVMIEMKPPIIYIAMMNAHMDSPGDATYGDDYGNERGLDPKSGRITMDTDFLHPMTIDDAALKNDTIIASMQRFTAAVTSSNIDIAITNPWVLKDYMENEIFYNLEEIYTAEELKELEELLWYEPDSTGNLVPVGIKINGHRDIDSFYEESEIVVIGIPRDSKRVERAKDFVAWMLEG